jgi:predicted nucleic acid-binding protein
LSTYLDTSALAKLYHQEAGSAFVEAILATNQPVFVSRLGVVEMHSVLSGKVRTKTLTQADSDLARQRFRSDVRKRRFRIIALRSRHYELADALIEAHGSASALRTLDSLQLAVALDLARNSLVAGFVTADKTLLKVGPLEKLTCIDPESATLSVP